MPLIDRCLRYHDAPLLYCNMLQAAFRMRKARRAYLIYKANMHTQGYTVFLCL